MRSFLKSLLVLAVLAPGGAYFVLYSAGSQYGQAFETAPRPRPAPERSPEIEALCEEYGQFKIFKSVVTEGFATNSARGCDGLCKAYLWTEGFSFVESELTQSYWDDRKFANGQKHEFVMRTRHLVPAPGWYRFELVNWGDPGTDLYEEYVDWRHIEITTRSGKPYEGPPLREINNDILQGKYSEAEIEQLRETTRFGKLIGSAIRTIPISGPTARYQDIHRYLGEHILHDNTVYMDVYLETVVDTLTQEELARNGAVYGGFLKTLRNGDVERVDYVGFCGVPRSMPRKDLLKIIQPVKK